MSEVGEFDHAPACDGTRLEFVCKAPDSCDFCVGDDLEFPDCPLFVEECEPCKLHEGWFCEGEESSDDGGADDFCGDDDQETKTGMVACDQFQSKDLDGEQHCSRKRKHNECGVRRKSNNALFDMVKDREFGEPTCEALKWFPTPFFEQDDENNDKGRDRFDDSEKKFHESPLCRKDMIDGER